MADVLAQHTQGAAYYAVLQAFHPRAVLLCRNVGYRRRLLASRQASSLPFAFDEVPTHYFINTRFCPLYSLCCQRRR